MLAATEPALMEACLVVAFLLAGGAFLVYRIIRRLG